jgi:hypothetical protein
MKVYYKYSACIKIVTRNISILCDPWFSDSAYYGTWARYPKHDLTKEFIGDFDIIWISHIHPDHYCPETIRKLFCLYGIKQIFIAEWGNNRNILRNKLISDGFGECIREIDEIRYADTLIKCLPNDTGSKSDIDSALIVADIETGKAVLNLNDCINSEAYAEEIRTYIESRSLSLSLFCLGYTGAGPYPQTYYPPGPILSHLAEKKKKEFFNRYLHSVSLIPSRYRLPFAGKYQLAGDLAFLNPYRGVADPLEVKKLDSDAIVLDDSGDAFFDCLTYEVSSERSDLYGVYADRRDVSDAFLWRRIISFIPDTSLLKRLLIQGVRRAHIKSECETDCIYSFNIIHDQYDHYVVAEDPVRCSEFLLEFNCNHSSDPFAPVASPVVRSEIYIERKALFAVLTGVCHWNNYEVGSVFFTRREPDIFDRGMQRYLNFLAVC